MLERRDVWPTAVTVGALLAWSTISYLTAWVDSDIVSDAIQVQHFVAHPFAMVTYPGQPYGGVMEAPLIALAEAIAPGNPYGFTLVRIAFLPIVGLLTCVNVRRVDTTWSLWPVAAWAIVCPAVLHSQLPIKDLYPFSWLIGMAGVSVLYSQFPHGRSTWKIVAGALLVGLAGYEHPASLLLSVPLIVAGVVRWRVVGRRAINTLIGIVIGLTPLLLQPQKTVVYGTGAPTGPRFLEAFGLAGNVPWASSIVPSAWGVQSIDRNTLAFPQVAQTVVNVGLLALSVVSVVVSALVLVDYVRDRGPRRYAFIATIWGVTTVLVIVLAAVVRPSQMYGGTVSLLVPFTLAALPSVLGPRSRIVVTGGVIALMTVTAFGTIAGTTPSLRQAIIDKANRVEAVERLASQISAAGFDYVAGDYWTVMPVGFASAGRLHPLALDTNRFPLDDNAPILVALLGPERRTDLVDRGCTPTEGGRPLPKAVTAFACPASAFAD